MREELLSDVFGKKVFQSIETVIENSVKIEFSKDGNIWTLMNIYELVHKCREWAVDNGYVLEIIPFCVNAINLKTLERTVFRYNEEDMLNQKPYLPKYEIMACEWIKGNKC